MQTGVSDGGFVSGQTFTSTDGSSGLDVRAQGQLLTSVSDQSQLLTSVNDQGQQEEQYDYSAPASQFQEGQQQTSVEIYDFELNWPKLGAKVASAPVPSLSSSLRTPPLPRPPSPSSALPPRLADSPRSPSRSPGRSTITMSLDVGDILKRTKSPSADLSRSSVLRFTTRVRSTILPHVSSRLAAALTSRHSSAMASLRAASSTEVGTPSSGGATGVSRWRTVLRASVRLTAADGSAIRPTETVRLHLRPPVPLEKFRVRNEITSFTGEVTDAGVTTDGEISSPGSEDVSSSNDITASDYEAFSTGGDDDGTFVDDNTAPGVLVESTSPAEEAAAVSTSSVDSAEVAIQVTDSGVSETTSEVADAPAVGSAASAVGSFVDGTTEEALVEVVEDPVVTEQAPLLGEEGTTSEAAPAAGEAQEQQEVQPQPSEYLPPPTDAPAPDFDVRAILQQVFQVPPD
ncbi:hypothetical protein FJT64_007732 [Amphibalanus amphitrite]|uniref:Uncharacterized protein n=1 Tax=Amphibalanus amphitrite TaxID=1232801 RepID=A0A6A4VJC6_AMPAM|nr:hypothetical protein FJT64_007732 [Amphibalanus amphitrite]